MESGETDSAIASLLGSKSSGEVWFSYSVDVVPQFLQLGFKGASFSELCSRLAALIVFLTTPLPLVEDYPFGFLGIRGAEMLSEQQPGF